MIESILLIFLFIVLVVLVIKIDGGKRISG